MLFLDFMINLGPKLPRKLTRCTMVTIPSGNGVLVIGVSPTNPVNKDNSRDLYELKSHHMQWKKICRPKSLILQHTPNGVGIIAIPISDDILNG